MGLRNAGRGQREGLKSDPRRIWGASLIEGMISEMITHDETYQIVQFMGRQLYYNKTDKNVNGGNYSQNYRNAPSKSLGISASPSQLVLCLNCPFILSYGREK